MPQLELHPVPLYNPLHPYHWEYDNLPLQGLITRDEVINAAVENAALVLREAQGTQGSLSNRLDQSIEEDGSIKTDAIDDAYHSIAYHLDGTIDLSDDELDDLTALGYAVSNPVPFVRMLSSERSKLALMADESTNMTIEVETPSNVVLFEQGPVTFADSSTVSWQVTDTNKIKANLGFPEESAHRHYYDLEPVTTDYTNYTTTSVSTVYVEDSLRVYINGVRLSTDVEIYVPGPLVSDTWFLVSYTPDHEAGAFELSRAISTDDIIRIDFDIALT